MNLRYASLAIFFILSCQSAHKTADTDEVDDPIEMLPEASTGVSMKSAPAASSCPQAKYEKHLVIHHIYVGQADSTFIRTPKGTTILIDAGLRGSGKEIVDRLKSCYGIDSLDYIVLTHFDVDHHGGMPYVIKNLKPKVAIYDPGDKAIGPKGSQESIVFYQNAANPTKLRKVPELTDSAIAPGDPVKFQVLAAGGKIRGLPNTYGTFDDTNSQSIAMKITYGKFDYFIGGDITGGGIKTPDVETALAPIVGDLDVFKASHHGSETSNNDNFVKAVMAENVIISHGNHKGHKHPSASVIKRFHLDPTIKNVYQTTRGTGAPAAGHLKKIKVVDGDIVVVASKTEYLIGRDKFRTDSK